MFTSSSTSCCSSEALTFLRRGPGVSPPLPPLFSHCFLEDCEFVIFLSNVLLIEGKKCKLKPNPGLTLAENLNEALGSLQSDSLLAPKINSPI